MIIKLVDKISGKLVRRETFFQQKDKENIYKVGGDLSCVLKID